MMKELNNKKVECYCNCCGTTFYKNEDELENVVCPECGCEYSEDNDYIEIYD